MQEDKPTEPKNLKWLFNKAKEGIIWVYSSQDMNPENRGRKDDKKPNP